MNKAIATLSLALVLTACDKAGGDTGPVPAHGTVTDSSHSAAWIQWMPGTTTCSGTICTTSPGYPIMWPESWRLEVTDLRNPDWVGEVEVDQTVHAQCKLRELWPECSQQP